MTNSIAFAPALALPFRSTAPRRCAVNRRIPVAMRIVGDPERSKDDSREDEGEPPLVGGLVPPTAFEDNDIKQSSEAHTDTKGVAGIADDDDFLLEDKPALKAHPPDVKSPADEIESRAKDESQPENNLEISDAPRDVDINSQASEKTDTIRDTAISDKQTGESKEKRPQPVNAAKGAEIETKAPEAAGSDERRDDSGKKIPQPTKTSVKMTPEQMKKAKATREAAVKAAEERDAKKAERGKELLVKAAIILTKVGTKSKAFDFGEIARARAEAFVENVISRGAEKDAPQQEKVKGSAASAAKSLVGTITKGWEETIAPKIRETLPSEYREVSNKALASAAVGLFVTVALFPSLFSGGGQKPKEVAKKKIDSETAMLEKKLQRDRSAPPSYSSRSASQKAVFPPEEKLGTVTGAPKSTTTPIEPKTEKPTAKVSEAPKRAPPAQTPLSLPQTSLSTTPKPEAVAPPPTATPPPKPVEPVKPRETEPPKPVEVTPAIVMKSVSKALGPNASLVSSASFDTLAAQPTIVLEVSKTFHNMSVGEQKRLAQVMLESARGLGYERVSLIEIGTGVEVAHAGLDVDLEDETANLRAQVGSLQLLSDKLAMANASMEAEIDALNRRISEEREEFALQKTELDKSINMLREETSGLVEDLADAKAEISEMPDRMALEERTIEAERKSEKLSDTVEMLSIQLSKARGDEAVAKKSQAESVETANQALKEKEAALAAVAGQIETAQKAAEGRADERIATVERDGKVLAEDANKRVAEVEQKLARTVEESKASAEETRKSYEKQLSDQKVNNEKEVQTIQSKYEAMLEEVQRRAQADLDAFQKEADRKMSTAMKEAKTLANSLTKERDNALKEVQKVEKQAEKAADRAAREKQGLQRRIDKLEAKLSNKASVLEEQPAVVETSSTR